MKGGDRVGADDVIHPLLISFKFISLLECVNVSGVVIFWCVCVCVLSRKFIKRLDNNQLLKKLGRSASSNEATGTPSALNDTVLIPSGTLGGFHGPSNVVK